MFNCPRTAVRYCYSLLLLLLLQHAVAAQQVRYFTPIDRIIDNNSQLQVVGKVQGQYLVYHSGTQDGPELFSYDSATGASREIDLPFIDPASTRLVNMVAEPDKLFMIIQEVRNGKHYCKTTLLDASGQLLRDPLIIDSSRMDIFGSAAFYHILVSPDKKQKVLYRIVRGFSNTQIFFSGIQLDDNGRILGNTSFYIPFNEEQEVTDDPFLNNDGMMFLPVHDRASNYKLGSTLRLYQSQFRNSPPKITEYYFKENKPVELVLTWQEEKNRLAMGGTYLNFYTKDLEGALALVWDKQVSRPDTVIFLPLEKKFKKSLKNKVYSIPLDETVNSLQMRYLNVQADGSIILLMDMFNNFSFYRNGVFVNVNNTRNPNTNNSSSNNPFQNNSSQFIQQTIQTRTNDRASTGTTGQRGPRSSGNATAVAPLMDMTNPPQSPSLTAANRISNANNNTINPPADPFAGFSAPITAKDAGDVMLRYKNMDYKSVVLFRDGKTGALTRTWNHHLFVPGTPFTNIAILPPTSNKISLLNYEVNGKNIPYLRQSTVGPDGNWTSTQPDKAGHPLLFFKRNYMHCDAHSLITLYNDPSSGETGLAVVNYAPTSLGNR